MFKLNWLTSALLIGLIPLGIRAFVAVGSTDVSWVVSFVGAEIFTVGLMINLASANELDHVEGINEAKKDILMESDELKSFRMWTRVLIAGVAVLIAGAYFRQIIPGVGFSLAFLLICGLFVDAASFVVGFAILKSSRGG